MMRPNQYQRLAMRTDCYKGFFEAALNLHAEVGKICGKIYKAYRDGDGTISGQARVDLMNECGDALWQLVKIIDHYGYQLEDVMKMNIEKLADRYSRDVVHGAGDNR